MTWIKIAKAKAILTKTDILGGPNDPAAIKVGKFSRCYARPAGRARTVLLMIFMPIWKLLSEKKILPGD